MPEPITDPKLAQMMLERIPATDDVASLPKRDRRSAKKIADYFLEQYNKGLVLRAPHAETWIKTVSILRGQHYFKVVNGVLTPLGKRNPLDIRAQVPVMEPEFNIELGRLNSNRVGVTVLPRLGQRPNAGFKAASGQAILDDWIEEICFEETFDESNQHLLMWGGFAYRRFIGPYHNQGSVMQTGYRSDDGSQFSNQTVNVEAAGQPEFFPIPFDSTSPAKCDGIMMVRTVTRQWLEQQDELYGAMGFGDRARKLATYADTHSASLGTRSTSITSHTLYGERIEGAVARWIWMKPNPMYPDGETYFMIADDLVGYQPTLPVGGFPLDFAYYVKRPNSFWGRSFCGPLISPQLEANRQFSSEIKAARFNKPFIVVDQEMVDLKDAQYSDNAVVGMRRGVLGEEKRVPFHYVPPIQQGREVSATLAMSLQFARTAAGHTSDIVYGAQEGRTEGGPATNLLNTNAQAPLLPTVKRMRQAQARMYPAVLNMLAEVWPSRKLVKSAGPYNMGRELMIQRQHVPRASDVLIIPAPMLPDGNNMLVQMLFEMRRLPNDENNRPMISAREFRRSMMHLGIAPPGIDMIDPMEDATMYRIMSLVGDTQQPAAKTFDEFDENERDAFRSQDHRMAIDMLRLKIAEPAFEMYSGFVQKALNDELAAHIAALNPAAPNDFDDRAEVADAESGERHLYAVEMVQDQDELLAESTQE